MTKKFLLFSQVVRVLFLWGGAELHFLGFLAILFLLIVWGFDLVYWVIAWFKIGGFVAAPLALLAVASDWATVMLMTIYQDWHNPVLVQNLAGDDPISVQIRDHAEQEWLSSWEIVAACTAISWLIASLADWVKKRRASSA